MAQNKASLAQALPTDGTNSAVELELISNELSLADYRLAAQLTEQIYASLKHPDHWQTAIEAITKALDAQSCVIWTSESFLLEGGRVMAAGNGQQIIDVYKRSAVPDSPLSNRLQELPPGRFYTSEQLVPRREMERTQMFQTIWRDNDIGYTLGGYIDREPDLFAVSWFYRGMAAAPFTQREVAMMEQLRPHLARAMRLRAEMLNAELLAHSGMQALESMAMAMVLLDKHGKPVYRSKLVESFIEARVIRIEKDALHFRDRETDHAFRGMLSPVRPANTALSGGFRLLHGENGTADIEILVLPYHENAGWLGSRAESVHTAVFLKRAGATPIPRDDDLRSLFGLTAAESRVCRALLAGDSTRKIAEQQGVSVDAIRFHCKNILRKTGNSRTSDLVKNLSLSVINLVGFRPSP